MLLATKFSKRLDRLWERRTAQLRAAVIPPGRGAAPKFTRAVRESYFRELLDLATKILVVRVAKREFRRITKQRKLLHITGRGMDRRREQLENWVYYRLHGPIVYSFWRGRRCLYVGKGKNPNRLYSYLRSYLLLKADCVEVYSIKSRSYLARAECLATHLYNPSDRRAEPARVRWGKRCPVCQKHDYIRSELTGLFRMR